MDINSDINVLGSIADFNLIVNYWRYTKDKSKTDNKKHDFRSFSNIKTSRSFERYERAIKNTLLKYKNQKLESLVNSVLKNEGITLNSLFLLFWNSSGNNELLHYLNSNVLFPALFSGRIAIKKSEVIACIKDIRPKEPALQKWTDSTIDVTARKYVAFLVKVKLMEGGRDKTLVHRYIDDKLFVIFLYWLSIIESKSNILNSNWLQYSFMEKATFIERIMQKRFKKFLAFEYSGDILIIEPLLHYEDLYDKLA